MAINPFDIKQKQYINFPVDVFIDACIISYQTADLPPGPLAETNDPVPSARFLFGGFIKDEDGKIKCDEHGVPVLVRKWTRWMRISNAKNSAMMKTFKGFDNLMNMLRDCETETSKLWTTPMMIQLEQQDNTPYSNIIKIKPGNNTELVANAFYDDKYIPYRVVKAFGKQQALTLAGCKFRSGIKTFDQTTMIDADEQN